MGDAHLFVGGEEHHFQDVEITPPMLVCGSAEPPLPRAMIVGHHMNTRLIAMALAGALAESVMLETRFDDHPSMPLLPRDLPPERLYRLEPQRFDVMSRPDTARKKARKAQRQARRVMRGSC